MAKDEEFSPLPYRRRSVPRGDTNVYRIVKPDGESVVSEGRTAAEAFKKSGVSRAIRIVRESYENKAILAKDEFPAEESAPAQTAGAKTETPQDMKDLGAPQETAPAAKAPAPPAKELSEDEIKKLLDDGKSG